MKLRKSAGILCDGAGTDCCGGRKLAARSGRERMSEARGARCGGDVTVGRPIDWRDRHTTLSQPRQWRAWGDVLPSSFGVPHAQRESDWDAGAARTGREAPQLHLASPGGSFGRHGNHKLKTWCNGRRRRKCVNLGPEDARGRGCRAGAGKGNCGTGPEKRGIQTRDLLGKYVEADHGSLVVYDERPECPST